MKIKTQIIFIITLTSALILEGCERKGDVVSAHQKMREDSVVQIKQINAANNSESNSSFYLMPKIELKSNLGQCLARQVAKTDPGIGPVSDSIEISLDYLGSDDVPDITFATGMSSDSYEGAYAIILRDRKTLSFDLQWNSISRGQEVDWFYGEMPAALAWLMPRSAGEPLPDQKYGQPIDIGPCLPYFAGSPPRPPKDSKKITTASIPVELFSIFEPPVKVGSCLMDVLFAAAPQLGKPNYIHIPDDAALTSPQGRLRVEVTTDKSNSTDHGYYALVFEGYWYYIDGFRPGHFYATEMERSVKVYSTNPDQYLFSLDVSGCENVISADPLP